MAQLFHLTKLAAILVEILSGIASRWVARCQTLHCHDVCGKLNVMLTVQSEPLVRLAKSPFKSHAGQGVLLLHHPRGGIRLGQHTDLCRLMVLVLLLY